jgi:hypothetical protein
MSTSCQKLRMTSVVSKYYLVLAFFIFKDFKKDKGGERSASRRCRRFLAVSRKLRQPSVVESVDSIIGADQSLRRGHVRDPYLVLAVII